MTPRINAAAIVTVAIAALASLTHFGHYTGGNAFDYYQFWMFGRAAHQSAPANIYSNEQTLQIGTAFYQQARAKPFSPRHQQVAELRQDAQALSTPLLYTFFGVISRGHFEGDFLDYQIITALCAIAAVLLLCRVMQYDWLAACLWLTFLFMWFGPFFSDVEVGNVNRIQLLMIAVFLWLQARQNPWVRDLLGGALLALMVAFKPNVALAPALLALAWLIDGQIARFGRQAIGVILGAAAAVVLSAAYFGSAQCWVDWLHALQATRENMQTHDAGNFSLAWYLTGRLGFDAALPLTAALSAIAVVAISLGRSNQPSPQRDLYIVNVGIGIALLAAPLTWHHYFLLATPMWLMLLQPRARYPRLMRWIGILLLVAAALDHLARDFVPAGGTFTLSRVVLWMTVCLPLLITYVLIARSEPLEKS